jgi:hypothetical protein
MIGRRVSEEEKKKKIQPTRLVNIQGQRPHSDANHALVVIEKLKRLRVQGEIARPFIEKELVNGRRLRL